MEGSLIIPRNVSCRPYRGRILGEVSRFLIAEALVFSSFPRDVRTSQQYVFPRRKGSTNSTRCSTVRIGAGTLVVRQPVTAISLVKWSTARPQKCIRIDDVLVFPGHVLFNTVLCLRIRPAVGEMIQLKRRKRRDHFLNQKGGRYLSLVVFSKPDLLQQRSEGISANSEHILLTVNIDATRHVWWHCPSQRHWVS